MEHEFLSSFHFPPGFRFHPSDEELVVHYLLNKLNSKPLPASVIAEIELYNYNPWELPKKALFGEDEWYFFSPRDRKYPNGDRPNRATTSGYWKATGTDKPILASGCRTIGVKKALVFYRGRPPKGIKTDWIMNEYRLPPTSRPSRLKGSIRLDDWVLCKVRQKGDKSKNSWEVPDSPENKELMSYYYPKIKELPSAHAHPNADAISDYGYRGCQVLASLLAASEPFPQIDNISSETFQYQDGFDRGKAPLVDSLFESPSSALNEKSNEEAMYEDLFSPATTVSNNKENEDLLLGNTTTAASNMHSYQPNQFQRDSFSPYASFYESSLTEGSL